jgi:TatA/E family protein of Tat protein translocase
MPTPGPLELVIILVIALLILGPGRLPDVGSALGKSIREFRKASSDIGDSLKVETTPLPPTPQEAPPAPAPTVAATTPAATTPAATTPAATTAEAPAEPVASTSSPAGTRPSEPTTGTN